MKALVFDRPAPDTSATRVADVATPEPGPGEVAIDVRAAGINFVDVMARRGDAGYAAGWPVVPGLEIAGTIRALGSGVSGPPIGTPVAAFSGSGGLAEVAVVRVSLVSEVPSGLSFEQAAAAPGTLTTATLLLNGLQPHDSLLVHSAAGGVGQALAALARLKGAHPILGSVGGAGRVQPAEKAGYDAVLVRGDELVASVLDQTGGRGVDLILDPQGTRGLADDLRMVAPGGRITLFGNAAGEPPEPVAVGPLFAGNAAVGGFSISRYAATAPSTVAAALTDVLAQLAKGTLNLDPTIVDGLQHAAEIQQLLAEGRGAGKYVIRV
jgi:NADPH2:quinone reductase